MRPREACSPRSTFARPRFHVGTEWDLSPLASTSTACGIPDAHMSRNSVRHWIRCFHATEDSADELMNVWTMIHDERAALHKDLELLSQSQWDSQSLCDQWSVREVVAHLTAAASVGKLRWFGSVLGARFNFDVHNRRRLNEHLGPTPADTLDNFRRIITSTTAPLGNPAAWLGEVIVHSADIRRPLGITTAPRKKAVLEVARFYASRNFAVPSESAIDGLRLEATDDSFSVGEGLMVRGTPLALTMAMAGRAAYCADLSGEGVATIPKRCPS